MKTSTIIIAMLMFVFTNMNAQNIYEDNFNSYDVDVDVTTLGFSLVNPLPATIQAADALNNNGSKFVKIAASGTSNINIKAPARNLEVGKSYTYEVMTSTPSAKNRTPYIYFTGGRTLGGTIVNAPAWTKSSYTFTVQTGESEVRVAVISQEKTIDVYFDDMLLYEYVAPAATPNLENGDTKVVKNILSGDFRIMSSLLVSAYEVLNANGQLIKTEKGLNSQAVNVSAGDFSKGVYVFKIMTANGKTIIQKIVNN